MAYFSNGSEGMCFDDQCSRCKYGQSPCPIAYAQVNWNYDQHKDQSGTAKEILDSLVKNDGTCTMFLQFKQDFAIPFKNADGSVTLPLTGLVVDFPLFPDNIPPIKNKE